jgi:anti-sigma factor (TIGR02949 family)
MADCNETIEQLEEFLDQELPTERVDAIVDHLKSCSDCQGAYEFHADLHRVISVKAQRDEVTPEFLGRLRECLNVEWSDDRR